MHHASRNMIHASWIMYHASCITHHASRTTAPCVVLYLTQHTFSLHHPYTRLRGSQACLNALMALHQSPASRDGTSAQRSASSTSAGDGGAIRAKSYKKASTTAPYPDRKPSFPSGAAGPVLSACAICLGRHQHRVYNCDAKKTWDQAYDTITKRIEKSLVLIDSGRTICCDWQRATGCASRAHDSRHLCSGCGKPTHGAQDCPRAQRA